MPVHCKKCETYFRVTIGTGRKLNKFPPDFEKELQSLIHEYIVTGKKDGITLFFKKWREKGENFGLKKESLNYRTFYHKISRERREFQQ